MKNQAENEKSANRHLLLSLVPSDLLSIAIEHAVLPEGNTVIHKLFHFDFPYVTIRSLSLLVTFLSIVLFYQF